VLFVLQMLSKVSVDV